MEGAIALTAWNLERVTNVSKVSVLTDQLTQLTVMGSRVHAHRHPEAQNHSPPASCCQPPQGHPVPLVAPGPPGTGPCVQRPKATPGIRRQLEWSRSPSKAFLPDCHFTANQTPTPGNPAEKGRMPLSQLAPQENEKNVFSINWHIEEK